MVLDDEPSTTYEIIGSGEVNEDDGTYPVRLRRLGRITDWWRLLSVIRGGELMRAILRES